MSWLRWTALALLLLLLLLGGALLWLLHTESGLQFALSRAESALDGKLSIGSARGSIAGPLHLRKLRWHGPAADASVEGLELDLDALALFAGNLSIDALQVHGVNVALHPQPEAQPQPETAFDLQPPIDIFLHKVGVADISITQDEQALFRANRIDLAGQWTGAGVVLETLAVDSPQGTISLHGDLAQAEGYRGAGALRFDWTQSGTRFAGTVDASSDGKKLRAHLELAQPMAASASASIAQDESMAWTVQLSVPPFDPQALLGEGKLKRLAANLEGSGNADGGKLTGTLNLNQHQLLLQPLRAHLEDGALIVDELVLRQANAPGVFSANGRVALDKEPVSAEFDANWSDVVLPADLVGQILHSEGALQVQGSAATWSATGDIAIGPPDQIAQLHVDVSGTPTQVKIDSLVLDQPKGHLRVEGELGLGTPLTWELKANAEDFNPGALISGWNGALDFALASNGTLTDRGPQGILKLENLGGTLRQRELDGHADLRFAPDWVFSGDLKLSAEDSNIVYHGRDGAANNASVTVDVASLGDWLPNASGSIHGNIGIQGIWPDLALEAQLEGSDLGLGESHIDSLALDASVPSTDPLKGQLALTARGVNAAQFAFDTVELQTSGSADSHEVSLTASGPELDFTTTIEGSWNAPDWSARITKLTLAPQALPPWKLQAPAALSYVNGAVELEQLCLSGGTPQICIAGTRQADGSASAQYQLQEFPLSLLRVLAAPEAPLRIDGVLDGQGQISIAADGMLDGNAKLTSTTGSVAYIESPEQPLLTWNDLVAAADFSTAAQRATVTARLNETGRLDAQVEISGAEQRLSGNIDVQLDKLAFIELFTSELASVKGSVQGHYAITGTLDAPQVSGQMQVSGFAAEVPRAGLSLKQGNIEITARDNKRFELHGSVMSGEGTLKIDGSGGLDAAAPLSITIQGEKVLAADIPAAHVVISPDLQLSRDERGYLLSGKVVVPKAEIDLSKLPGGGAPATSSDVVIIDAEKLEKGEPVPLRANVTVVLGEDVEIAGFGFDGAVTGELAISERPGKPTTARGQLRVSGTYQAYGQDLSIERGNILFADSPLSNPGLNIRAVREIPEADVTVGVSVQGTVQRPLLTVYSDPAMEQSEALSYLVTGRPLSALKSGEGDMVSSAAQALGTAAGDRLAKSLGGRLGIDDIGVSDNSAIGGAAFSVGKYLSPRLYLSYGVGLFTPGEVITLRYLLSQRWNLEIQSATEFNRAGLNYRYEK